MHERKEKPVSPVKEWKGDQKEKAHLDCGMRDGTVNPIVRKRLVPREPKRQDDPRDYEEAYFIADESHYENEDIPVHDRGRYLPSPFTGPDYELDFNE